MTSSVISGTLHARAQALAAVGAAARDRIDTGRDWISPLDHGLRTMEATWQESARTSSSAAWHARQVGRDTIIELSNLPLPRAGFTAPHARTWWHLYFSALRFDLRCRAIHTVFQALDPPAAEGTDPYIQAHAVFAVLGQSKPAGLGMLDDLLAEPEAADSREVLHVILHGLWLGHLLPGRADRILHLAALPPLARTADPIALMRKAGALRQLGRHHDALDAIDHAIDALPAGDAAVHADLVRERTLITCALDQAHHPAPTGGTSR